jgi:hypothetical protein
MRPIRRIHTPALSAGLLAAFLGTATPCAAEWRRIDTPNFVVVGDVGERTLRGIAVQFEGFRETLTRVLTERATATPVPTVVIVFPSDRAFNPFKPTYQGKPMAIAGLFVSNQNANHIAVLADSGEDGLRIVFHEYAHLVVSNVMRNVPAWLSEGLAEFYSTYQVSDGGREAVLGRPIVDHLLRLQDTKLLKLDDLLNVDHQSPLYNEEDRSSVFYAQSWALTHRILMGEPRRSTELGTYLQRVSEGAAPMQAWQQTFGTANMDRELGDYVRRRVFKAVQYKFPEKLAKLDARATVLSAADAEAFLSEFLVQQERYDEAAARLSPAAKLSPDNPRLKLVLALLDVARDDHQSAGKRLLSLDTTDWLVAYSAAMGIADVVEGGGDAAAPEQVEAARRLVRVVSEARGDVPNALARLAMLELRSADGPTRETLRVIERARQMAAGREDYAFVHAQVLAHLSDFAAARNVAGSLMSSPYSAELRESGRTLMRHILQLQGAAQSQGSRSSEPAAAPSSASDRTEGPATQALRPAFRALQAGEQRIEGGLERIECPPGGSAVFHLRTAGGPISAAAARMAEVEFITYRDDLSGSVRCGALDAALPVYLTWRPGSGAADGKMAIAIEFLPK